jgi:hypothetical protein
LLDEVARQKTNYVNIDTVERALMRAVDNSDIKVNCTCPDFRYRMAYYATQDDFKWGEPENRKPKKTNPDKNIGPVCKHLASVLSNKKSLRPAASSINDWIKSHVDDIRDELGLSEEDFYINAINYALGKKSRQSREKPGRNAPNVEIDSDELELNV